MEKIIAEIVFPFSSQILRKVCHGLRNYIDDKIPDSKLTRISISRTKYLVSIEYVHGDYQKGMRVGILPLWCPE